MLYVFLSFLTFMNICLGNENSNQSACHNASIYINFSGQQIHPQDQINQIRAMLPLLPYQQTNPVFHQDQSSKHVQELAQISVLTNHKHTQRALRALGALDDQACIRITQMTPMELEQMFRCDWPHFMNMLLKNTNLSDDVVWILFNQYASSKCQSWNKDDIKQNRAKIEYTLESRNKLKAAKAEQYYSQQKREGEILLQSQAIQRELQQRFGCPATLCKEITIQAARSGNINDWELLPKILPDVMLQHSNQFGLLPSFAHDPRAITLNFDNQIIPQSLQLPANYFLATIQKTQSNQIAHFLAQQGLESIAQASLLNPQQHAFETHAQQMYQLLRDPTVLQENMHFKLHPQMLQQIQELELLYQEFSDSDDDEDNILLQRHKALQSTLENPDQTNITEAPANVLGFMQAHGLDHSILLTYRQNAIQQEITHETICIIQQAMQVESITPLTMVGRSIRLFHSAVGQISQQTLLYNKLGQIADAFESADIGWCLVTYGPDMIAGAFDCIVAPIQLTATVAIGAGYATLHPLETLQMVTNGCNFICDATQTIGKKLYDGAMATGHYIIHHNPNDWYSDTGNLCRRSIDIAHDVQNQAYDYISSVDSHKSVRAATSLGVGWFVVPLVQARVAASMNAFTNSIQTALLQKATSLQIACAATLAKGMQQTKQLGYQARQKLCHVIKKTDELIQDLLPEHELAAHTPYGDIIKFSHQPTLTQSVKDQLFLCSETVKNKANAIISVISPNSFAKYNRSDIILPEVINSSGIRQIEAWRIQTNNFKHLGSLHDYHKLYLNYAYWLHQELQPLQNQIKNLNLSFRHGGRLHKIESVDLLHVFLGDIIPGKVKISGMHYLSHFTKALYYYEQVSPQQSFIKKINIFRKNNNLQVGAYKPSSLFPSSWDIKMCFQKSIEALQNKPFLDAHIYNASIIIQSKTKSGIKIEFIYDPVTQKIKSFYPTLKA